MKRPSFQFYPADWRNNAKLRRCSWEARGVWLEVMCLLHDSEDYGMLRWSLKEIAQAVGAPIKILSELVSKGVLKGGDGQYEALVYTPRSGRQIGDPVTLIEAGSGSLWYSSRMVEDEHVRQKRGNHELYKASPNTSPKGGIGDDIKQSPNKSSIPPESDLPTSSSTSTSKNKETTAANNSDGMPLIDSSPPSPDVEKTEHPENPVERPVQISVLLRAWEKARGKVAKTTSSNPILQAWSEAGVTDQQLREAYEIAVADREAKGDNTAINAGFLDLFVARLLNPGEGVSAINRAPTAAAKPWQASWSGIEGKGRELGIIQAQSEHPQAFKARVFEAAQMTEHEKAVLRADHGLQI